MQIPLDAWTVEHFERARQEQQQKHLEAAAVEYRSIVARNPKFAEAYLNLGLVYYTQKRYRDAIDAFKTGLSIKPDLLGARVLLGISLYSIQDFQTALKPLHAALRLNPKERQAGLYLALTYLGLDEPEQAARQLRRTATCYPDDIEVAYQLGSAYNEGVRQSTKQLHSAGRDSALYHWASALAAARKNDPTAAIQEYVKSLAIDPNIPQAYFGLANLFQKAGSPDLSDAAWQRFAGLTSKEGSHLQRPTAVEPTVQLDPDTAKANRQLWESLPPVRLEPGVPVIADAFVNKAAQERLQGDKSGAFSAGLALYEAGDYRGAAGIFRKTTESARGDWVPAYVLVRACVMQGDYDGAEEALEDSLLPYDQIPSIALLKIEVQSELALCYYERVASSETDSVRAKLLLAKSYASSYQVAEALATYQEILKIHLDQPEVHLAMGEIYEDQIEWPKAVEHYRKELELSPGNGLALALLGHAYAEAHDVDSALPVLNKVIERYPKDADALADLGKVCALKGDSAKAIQAYERALALDSTRGEWHYRLFQLYRAAGEPELAQKHLQEFQAVSARKKKERVIVDR